MLRLIAASRAAPLRAGLRVVGVRAYAGGEAAHFEDHGLRPKPDTIPSNLEQATGLEREEYLATLEGKSRFVLDPMPVKHFGTTEKPVIVYSAEPDRIVACNHCGADEPGFNLWFNIRIGEKKRCSECGQCYECRADPSAGLDAYNAATAGASAH